MSASRFVPVGDLVVHAALHGDPRQPTLVFANALGTDWRIWDAVFPAFTDRYGVLLYDKRGHGLSDAPRGPYSIADHAEDLLGLLAHFGIGRYVLVGLSVGGLIAQSIAIGNPDGLAALVLCDTAAKIGDAARWDARIETAEYKGMEALGNGTMERWFTRAYREAEPAAMRGWRNMLVRQPAQGYAATCAAIRDADFRASLTTIRVPTLVLVGDQDPETPPDLVRDTAALIPEARFAVLPDAGHLSCIEQPGALADLITAHLRTAGLP